MKKDIRLSILNIENEKSCGGCIWFKGATLKQLKELFEIGELDLTEQQNDAPDVQTLMKIMMEFNELGVEATAHGYVVSKERGDSRVSLEGLYIERPESMRAVNWIVLMEKFTEQFRHADEFQATTTKLYAWFD